MTQQLRSIGAVSIAKILAVLYAVVGLLIGTVFFLIIVLGSMAGRPSDFGLQGGPFAFLLGVGSIVFFPICYALIGAIGGLIFAGIYNLVARYVGGIEVEIG